MIVIHNHGSVVLFFNIESIKKKQYHIIIYKQNNNLL